MTGDRLVRGPTAKIADWWGPIAPIAYSYVPKTPVVPVVVDWWMVRPFWKRDLYFSCTPNRRTHHDDVGWRQRPSRAKIWQLHDEVPDEKDSAGCSWLWKYRVKNLSPYMGSDASTTTRIIRDSILNKIWGRYFLFCTPVIYKWQVADKTKVSYLVETQTFCNLATPHSIVVVYITAPTQTCVRCCQVSNKFWSFKQHFC